MNYKLRNMPFICELTAISLLFVAGVISLSSLYVVNQLNLKMEPTLSDFDSYLENYVGDAESVALLLDYDGTLAEITPHPSVTFMSDETEEIFKKIAKNPKIYTAVISGRGIGDAKSKVKIDDIVYAGNHGLEILFADGSRFDYEIPYEISGHFDELIDELNKIARDGAWVENKRVSITFHYRAVCEDEHETIRDEAAAIISRYGYRPNQAHCAIEAKPPVAWNKGKACEYILKKQFGNKWRNNVKVIASGDDTTDEDSFEFLQGAGITFRVTEDPLLKTKATYKIPSTKSVTTLLEWIDRKFN